MLPNDFYHAFLTTTFNNQPYYAPAGRFWVNNGCLEVLEDPYEMFKLLPRGPVDETTMGVLGARNPTLNIASYQDLVAGHNLDYIPELENPGPIYQYPEVGPDQIQQASMGEIPEHTIYHYQRLGYDKPHVLESHSSGECFLDGNPLSPEEQEVILTNVANKLAALTPISTLAKSEFMYEFADLTKMDPQEALRLLQELSVGHPEEQRISQAVGALRTQVFEDPRFPGMGNKYAYQQHLKNKETNPGGYSVFADVNGLKTANDTLGHSAGDKLIRGAGGAVQNAAKRAAPGRYKAFATGGDEFQLHFDNEEDAHAFQRELRTDLDQIEPVGGSHRVSLSMGHGPNPELADQALYHAKAKKMAHLQSGGGAHNWDSLYSSGHTELAPKVEPGAGPKADVSAPKVATPVASKPGPEAPKMAPAPKTPEVMETKTKSPKPKTL